MRTQNTTTGAGTSAVQVTIPMSVLQSLIFEAQDLIDFAETYGPSERASVIDWSDYLEQTQKAVNKAHKAMNKSLKPPIELTGWTRMA
jgi:hypothetical protein